MELHNPNNQLPALKFEKKQERFKIENDSTVKNLIQTNLLLNKDLNQLLYKILQLTNDINKLFGEKERDLNEKDIYFSRFIHNYRSPSERHQAFMLFRKLRTATPTQKKELEKELKELMYNEQRKINIQLKNKIKRYSDEIQNLVNSFEIRRKCGLDILSNKTLYLCPKCKKICSVDKFQTMNCKCGQEIKSSKSIEKLPIYMFDKEMIEFIDKNMWLEHGINYLLRRKNFQTLCGIYILGHSGVRHEIDNVGDSLPENFRIFCECKNQDITVNDVFIFSGKMIDIGCSRGYIFTTSFDINKEIKQLARSKNISIIESVLEKKEKEIMMEIKEGTINK